MLGGERYQPRDACMRTIWKVTASLVAFPIVILIAAAAIEIVTGVARPGFVPMLTMVIMIPLMYVIWRKR
jgi:hypothetical protein